jgi:hypothetical protein
MKRQDVTSDGVMKIPPLPIGLDIKPGEPSNPSPAVMVVPSEDDILAPTLHPETRRARRYLQRQCCAALKD